MTKMYATYRTVLFLLILSASHFIGGVDAFAQTDRNMYEIVAENNNSHITTVFQVFAESERDAKENVALNGWKIVSIKQLNIQKRVMPNLSPDDATAGKVVLESPLTKKGFYIEEVSPVKKAVTPVTDDEIIDSILKNIPGYVEGSGYALPELPDLATGGGAPDKNPDVPANIPAHISEMNNLDNTPKLPDSGDLVYLYTVYFNLGDYGLVLPESTANYLAGLDKNGTYYVFGNTDNIPVTRGSKAYKDNFDLSVKRANSVKEYLTENGMKSASITALGLGSLYPAVKNQDNPGGTFQNRRVDIYGFKQKK